jgi:hypothetical protein
VKSLSVMVGAVVLLTLAAIVIHETGHFLVYAAAGYPTKITLQSVSPVGEVDPILDHWAMLAGPVLSWVSAVIFLLVATRRPAFGWAAAAFTNASLRLFPCVMDLTRALTNGHPFSDEGNVAMAITTSAAGRSAIVLLAIAVSVTLMVAAAKRFRFARWGALKSIGIYALSLAVGIAVIIADELLRG